MGGIIVKHGGFRDLMSFQMATIVYDLTVFFCQKYIDRKSRTVDQMVQAARSGRQNIAEGCQVSGVSKKMEMKLVGVARASLEELLLDYEDFLRQNQLEIWKKEDLRVKKIRELSFIKDKSYRTYLTYLNDKESAANCLKCLIHQANYLLDRQLKVLEEEFLKNGGFTERLYRARSGRGN